MFFKTFIIILVMLFSSNAVSDSYTPVMSETLKIPPEKAVIKFQTKLGIVTFAHEKHAELSITECITCHHKQQADDTEVKACHACHQHKKTEFIKARLAFHDRCTGCHEYTTKMGQQAGPLKRKCKLCHIKDKK